MTPEEIKIQIRSFAVSRVFKVYLIILLIGCFYCYSIDPQVKLDITQGLLLLNTAGILLYYYYNILHITR